MMLRRPSTQRTWIALSLIVVLLLAACGTELTVTDSPTSPAQPTAHLPIAEPAAQAPYVGTLRLPSGGYWGHPSPFGFNRGPGFSRASLVFDTLVWRDASGETIPWLATDWSLSDDELTWTFTLREGVQWQDGQPLTADDVAFSIDYYLAHPGAGWFMAQVNEVESAIVVGEDQVAIRLVRPYAPFLQTIAEAVLIFPRHIWQDVTDPQAFAEPAAFIGSGAYRLVEFSQEESTYLFEANPDFFLGLPYVRRIEFVPTSDDILALSNGDVAAFDKFGGVTQEMLEPFRQEPFAIQEAPGEWGMFLYFNLEKETPLRDVRVRQAIAHAIDRQAMVDRILFGFGGPGSPGFLPPSNPMYNPNVRDYPVDLEQAKALLAEAGYDSTPIQIAYSPDWIMASPRVVEIVEAGLSEIGIILDKVSMDQATIDAVANEGSYEILITGFGGLGGDADQLRRSFASSSQSRGFSRALGYSNAKFDALAAAQVLMTDPAQREAALNEMQAILAEDLPALALYYTTRVVVYNAEAFDNWYFTPGGYGGGIPQPYNKHQFIVGVPEGLAIRGGE
ncbi:MAG: ABC transporter substrate-binding protein [Anaerolineae bacterium]|nr:ABC transporter substrate-binding protein [Anaerolineae bacterium]